MTLPSLVADIGGTNTRLGLVRDGALCPNSLRRYRNAGREQFEDLLSLYLRNMSVDSCAGAVVAMAGPVGTGGGQMTNLGWTITRTSLANSCQVADPSRAPHVYVMNDLQAQGLALDLLPAGDVRPLIDGQAQNNAPRLVIGIGTGFNCATVLPRSARPMAGLPTVRPSETGHATLPAPGPDLANLVRFYEQRIGHVAIEDILSGRGLERCDHYISHISGPADRRSSIDILSAVNAGEAQAKQSLALFFTALAEVVGNLALTFLPHGGIVLTGGMSRAVAPHLHQAGFADRLYDKGRFSGFLRQFPLSVLQNDDAALLGCARYLAQRMPPQPIV